MTRIFTIALAFSFAYFLELLVFGIGALKEGGGRGFAYCFLAVLIVVWAGFLSIRKRRFRFKAGFFLAFAVALSLWVLPARRIEIAIEEREDRETIGNQRRIEVSNVSDEPLLTSQGKPAGIRMRYSIRFPRAGVYPPAPLLAATDERLPARFMRSIRTEITPRPDQTRSDPLNTGTYARYKGSITYNFVVDLVPGFIIVSPNNAKSCFSFINEGERKALATSGIATRFNVHIDGTDYGGYLGGPAQLTRHAYRLKDFYGTAVASGAKESCVFNSKGDML